MGSFGGGGRDQMIKSTDFVQKLLHDLRRRKEKMGFSTALAATGYKNSQRQATVQSIYNSNKNTTPSLELVPVGGRNTGQHTADLSTALALALNSSGKICNIEILNNPTMGRKIVLHMDGSNTKKPFPSPYPSRLGQVAEGVENLTMILKACSKRYNHSRDFIELGRELLKGAMDLEESLKLLQTLQEASDCTNHSQGRQHLKLMKGKEDEDEESRRGYQHNAGSRSKFSFIRESRSSASNNEKSRHPLTSNTYRNSSKCSTHSIKGCSDLKPEAPAVSHGSREIVQFSKQNQASSKANPASQKVRMPNVIAKLMGLEELPTPTEEKSAGTWCRTPRIDNETKMMKSTEKTRGFGEQQEKVVNDIAKSGFRRWRSSDNKTSLASKALKNACAGNYDQMDVNNMNNKNETGVSKEAAEIRERKIEGRTGHVIPVVGNYLPEYITTNNIRIRKKNATANREENMQQTKEKIDASVNKMIDSDNEQKRRTLSISHGKHESQRKKEIILIKEELDYEMMRAQSGKEESVYSNTKGLVNRTASQPPKENIKTSMTNEHRGKKPIEQISNKRLPLNRDAREKMARTSIQEKVTRKITKHNQSVQELNDLIKISESVVQVPVRARESKDQRSCALEMEYRRKERNSKVEGAEKGDGAILKFNLQKEIQTVASVNPPVEDGNMRITNCNPATGEEIRTAACSNPATGDENIQVSMDQPIQEEIKMKSEDKNSVSQHGERTCITMTERVECSGEDVKERYEETQSVENKEEATKPSRLMQHSDVKYIVCRNWTMEVDQQVLTEHEDALKRTLITSQKFLNIAQSRFQIKIPVDILQENVSPHKQSRLVIDCGNEILRRKGQREEVSFSGKSFLAPMKRSIDTLIKEVNADLESLKYENNASDCDLADCLNKMIENDIHRRDPDINCLWDIGWDSKTLVCLEKREIVKDVEKHLLNGLLNELATDLLDVSISSL